MRSALLTRLLPGLLMLAQLLVGVGGPGACLTGAGGPSSSCCCEAPLGPEAVDAESRAPGSRAPESSGPATNGPATNGHGLAAAAPGSCCASLPAPEPLPEPDPEPDAPCGCSFDRAPANAPLDLEAGFTVLLEPLAAGPRVVFVEPWPTRLRVPRAGRATRARPSPLLKSRRLRI